MGEDKAMLNAVLIIAAIIILIVAAIIIVSRVANALPTYGLSPWFRHTQYVVVGAK
jgi:hypothetical protein